MCIQFTTLHKMFQNMLILNSEPNHTSDNVINSHTCAYQNYDDETINVPQKLFTFKFLTSWIYLHTYIVLPHVRLCLLWNMYSKLLTLNKKTYLLCCGITNTTCFNPRIMLFVAMSGEFDSLKLINSKPLSIYLRVYIPDATT